MPCWNLSQLAELLDAEPLGDLDFEVSGLQAPEQAGPLDVAFLLEERWLDRALESCAGALVLQGKYLTERLRSRPVLLVENPRKAFVRALRLFYPEKKLRHSISDRVVIGANVFLSEPVHLSDYVVIGDNTRIAARTKIGAHVSIGADVTLGSDVRIGSNVSIADDVIIGDRVVIHAGTVIGSDGYGFYQDAGRHHKIPQVGSVEIHDDVEIGANVTIDCGTLGNTVIGEGTKIDNLVQIGHNVKIGKHCLIVSQVGISGSTILGDYVVLAGQTGVAGHLKIGDGVVAAGKSGITQDIEANCKISGYPAHSHIAELREKAALKRLPEMMRWWQKK